MNYEVPMSLTGARLGDVRSVLGVEPQPSNAALPEQFWEDAARRGFRTGITSCAVLAVVWGGLPAREMADTFGVSLQSGTLATLRSSPQREDPDVVNLRA
jgi:hypothetical protein